jgi:two-component system sensor histidine kinase UhpB
MSLRHQIIFRILISSLCILLLGGALAVWQARQSVAKEVEASIHLALQLISLGMADAPIFQQMDDLSHLRALQQTRHLSIQVQKPDGQLIHFTGDDQPSHPEQMPPAWFIHLVQGNYPKVEHQLQSRDGKLLTLIIQAQPLDEISEVWQESLEFFASILCLTLLTFVAVNLVFNKSLKSIAVIVEALHEVETGHYQHKLPQFAVIEFDNIAKAVNHMTEELEKARQENTALTQHSLAIQEEERQRLAQELHDELGQSLTAIKVMAVTVAHPKADTQKISTSISQICEHLMRVVRLMMQQLHPLVLTELGLKATLEDMVQHWSERNPDLVLNIQCKDELDYLDKSISIQVFRVIQECLTNVVRHAQAQHVDIQLALLENPQTALLLTVQDDGIGCDLTKTQRGFGLLGMQERIKSLHGELHHQSQPGTGMRISAWIPLG